MGEKGGVWLGAGCGGELVTCQVWGGDKSSPDLSTHPQHRPLSPHCRDFMEPHAGGTATHTLKPSNWGPVQPVWFSDL